VEVLYSTAALKLNVCSNSGLVLVSTDRAGEPLLMKVKAIILVGGFESSSHMRLEHFGLGWELASVRGTPCNTGKVLEIAIRNISAQKARQWSGCYSVAWDVNSPANSGDRDISNEFTKSGYPLGTTVNIKGERFFGEGADLWNYTYAKFGKAILAQPQSVEFHTWDSKGIPWLRHEEYRGEIVEKLAKECSQKELENAVQCVETVKRYNETVYNH
jgi:hypothetical protein